MLIDHRIATLFLTIAFMGAGCSTLPIDTLNKRIAAFEIAYEQVLVTVDRWIDEGRLTGDRKKQVQDQIRATRTARLAIYIAKESGDIVAAQGKLTAATAALQILREYVAKQEAGENQTRLDYWQFQAGLEHRGLRYE